MPPPGPVRHPFRAGIPVMPVQWNQRPRAERDRAEAGSSFAPPYIAGGSSFSACVAIGIIFSQKSFLFFSASVSISA